MGFFSLLKGKKSENKSCCSVKVVEVKEKEKQSCCTPRDQK